METIESDWPVADLPDGTRLRLVYVKPDRPPLSPVAPFTANLLAAAQHTLLLAEMLKKADRDFAAIDFACALRALAQVAEKRFQVRIVRERQDESPSGWSECRLCPIRTH